MLDIEDINKLTDNAELFEIYSQIIHTLLDWVTHYNNDIAKMKQLFANKFSQLERENRKNLAQNKK